MWARAMALYHVTLTENVGSILRSGINLFGGPAGISHWTVGDSGDRYGGGEIYAFEDEIDAYRWAFKMDWEQHGDLGSGKISIVVFEDDGKGWKQDTSDPIFQAGLRGRSIRRGLPVPPELIQEIVRVTAKDVGRLQSNPPEGYYRAV